MEGFVIGAVSVLGVLFVTRMFMWRRYAWRRGHGGGCGHGGRRGRRGRGRGDFTGEGFSRAVSEVFKRRLDIDEEQDGIVDHAFADARKALAELKEELAATRQPIADALRGEAVDDGALAAAFARQDDALARARRQVLSSVKQVHAVLEPDQRKQAADWIAATEGRWV